MSLKKLFLLVPQIFKKLIFILFFGVIDVIIYDKGVINRESPWFMNGEIFFSSFFFFLWNVHCFLYSLLFSFSALFTVQDGDFHRDRGTKRLDDRAIKKVFSFLKKLYKKDSILKHTTFKSTTECFDEKKTWYTRKFEEKFDWKVKLIKI